ncbi:geranylgeranyl reductase family protein [Thermodesulfobium sp. 4217-1]|uniref:geranylgeranyl reductase family protein n=1 Tax=Thermodesulfobium sp. 4217-1 TaxID=3120013 RepID=UPI0032215269
MNKKILEFDVVICGSGPAGATAAALLAKNGLKVALIDKEDFPRDKLCGGLLTEKSYKLIESIFGSDFFEPDLIEFSSSKFEIFYGKLKVLSALSKKLFIYVNRKKFDFAILQRALGFRAYFFNKTKVIDIDIKNMSVFTNNNIFKGKYIVDAEGVNSVVRGCLIKNGILDDGGYKENLTLAMEFYDYKLTTDRASIYFGFTKFGYGWIFPNKERTLVGIGALISKNRGLIKKQFKNFLNLIKVEGPANSGAHLIPTGWIPDRLGCDNILLVGDAGGFVDPITGEGIYYAIKTGQMAADAILMSEKNKLFAEINYNLSAQNIVSNLSKRKTYRNLIFGTRFRLVMKFFLLIILFAFKDKLLKFIHE